MRVAVLLLGAACHHTTPRDEPASCLVEHDGGPTQCFDEIGETARTQGPALCAKMYGEHSFRVGTACPTDGVLVSCRKNAGTELERVERCYRNDAACEARCAKNGGVVTRN